MSKPLADQFWEAIDAPRKEKFTLPNGVTVWVEEIGADEWLDIKLKIGKAQTEAEDHRDRLADARLIVRCVTDGSGGMIFTDADMPKLAHLPLHVFDALMDVVNRVNFAGPKVQEEAKKNSGEAPDSSGDSAATSASSTGDAPSSDSPPAT